MWQNIQPLIFPLSLGSEWTGNNTFTTWNHPGVEAEEINWDGIAPFGDVDKEYTQKPWRLGQIFK